MGSVRETKIVPIARSSQSIGAIATEWFPPTRAAIWRSASGTPGSLTLAKCHQPPLTNGQLSGGARYRQREGAAYAFVPVRIGPADRADPENLVIDEKYHHVRAIEQPAPFEHLVEHRRGIGHRIADHLARRQSRSAVAALRRSPACLHLVEQARILDRDDGLVSKGVVN